jgi:uncharacterized Ntn-hydrolase superfamily protein
MWKPNVFELGTETHTFTAIGRCPRTGRLGISISTGEVAVGGRCIYVKPNVGAVATQARTNPLLGPFAIQLMELGYPASRALAELEVSDPYIEYRQLGIVDQWGHTAVRTGSSNGNWKGHLTGDGWITMGNGIVDEGVVKAMAKAMEESVEEEIEVRLMKAVSAGTDAGGQPNGQRSAGILVYENEGFTIINLRVDDSDTPMADLWKIFDKFQPMLDYYKKRPFDPTIGAATEWAAAQAKKL